MQYVRLAVPQELYQSLGFCPEMALLLSSNQSIKIVPLSSICRSPSSSDPGMSENVQNSSQLELQSKTSAPLTEKCDGSVENPDTLASDPSSSNQNYNDSPVEQDVTAATGEKSDESGTAPHVGMEVSQSKTQHSSLHDHGYQGIEGESSTSCNEAERESLLEKSLDSSESVNTSNSANLLDQGSSPDKVLAESLLDLSSERIGDSSFKDRVLCKASSPDGAANDSPREAVSDDDVASEEFLKPFLLSSEKAVNEVSQSDCFSSPAKKRLKVEPEKDKVPFIKVCDNCKRTYRAAKTFQRHKKNCEKFKAELALGKTQRGRGTPSSSSKSAFDKDFISEVASKGPKTINHLLWKKGPTVDITCQKCNMKFFSVHRYERHLVNCKGTQETDILDNSVEKDKSVKWFRAPTDSTKNPQQHYFVLRR